MFWNLPGIQLEDPDQGEIKDILILHLILKTDLTLKIY
jgi:hypothetical protein